MLSQLMLSAGILLAPEQNVMQLSRPPLLSACLIVKDEEENIAACLAALTGVVDEIVVYDTGSTDDTVALARAAGAVVVAGDWHDDFARARNSALAACTGVWVLSVDADEVVHADAGELRAQLEATRAQALTIAIDNLGDNGQVGARHVAMRLFRRSEASWRGRLHERLVPRDGTTPEVGSCTALTLTHSGYTSAAQAARGKVERNRRVASAAVAADPDDLHATLALARALTAAGRPEEALLHFSDVRTRSRDRGLTRNALRHGSEAHLTLEQPTQALAWVEHLREYTSETAMPDYLEGLARAQAGELEAALDLLESLVGVADEELSIPSDVVDVKVAGIQADAGRWTAAADRLWRLADEGLLPPSSWCLLAEAQWRSGRGLGRVADVLPVDRFPVLVAFLEGHVEAADLLLDVLWERSEGDLQVLAVAAQLGPRLSLARAVDWAVRLRAVGLESQCTLAALAQKGDGCPLDRLRACAILHQGLDDARGKAAMADVAAQVPADDFHAALLALDEISPPLLGRFVRLAATDPDRTRAMAAVLRGVGAQEQAEALLASSAS